MEGIGFETDGLWSLQMTSDQDIVLRQCIVEIQNQPGGDSDTDLWMCVCVLRDGLASSKARHLCKLMVENIVNRWVGILKQATSTSHP